MANESLDATKTADFVPDANEMQLTVYERHCLKGLRRGWSLTSELERFKHGTLIKY